MSAADEPRRGGGEGVDVRALMAEIEAEVERKRREGLYPAEIVAELDTLADLGDLGVSDDDLSRILAQLRAAASFSPVVTTASSKPLVAPVVSGVKRGIQASVRWYIGGVLSQVGYFAAATHRAVQVLSRRIQELDSELETERSWRESLEERVLELEQSEGKGRAGRSRRIERAFDYMALENRFRGSEDEIRARQRHYAGMFGDAAPVVDLGCGRGEFLELMRELETEAYGVDRHPDMVEHCRAKGLRVDRQDVISHLEGISPASMGGIFSAQTIEHLETEQVPAFFELAAAALRPGGLLVVETVNPQSLYVFAHSMYIDLGHLRPLHPLTLRFLAEASGFSEARVEFANPPPPSERPQPLSAEVLAGSGGLVDEVNENFARVERILFGPQDFALIARR